MMIDGNRHEVKIIFEVITGVFNCHEQQELASMLASNLGYELKAEDERKKNTIEELALLIIEASKEARNHDVLYTGTLGVSGGKTS